MEVASTRLFLVGLLCCYRMTHPAQTAVERADDVLSVALPHLAAKAHGSFSILS